ncbi:MAG TPA: alpha/beta hydrolase [Pyrinomonadaceae bacterium]|nr:alpha/beta hydrolase [Pyrinomonadaceae bacterium]
MPSLQGGFFNAFIRLFIRRRYGFDEYALAKKARRIFGSPRIFQWIHTRGLSLRYVNEENVRGEWLETEQTEQGAIFYIHGGGYVSCSAKTHRPITATLARLTRFRVFSLEYRLAPEDRFPAALDDAFAAYNWLLEQNISPSKIALAGDSAGGGLVLALLLRLRDSKLPLPACAVCFSAWTDLAGTGESIRTNGDRDDMFYPENIPEFAAAYLGETPAENPFASPVFGDYKNLPPILFQVGSTEVLLDDSRRIHQKIQEAGGISEIEIFDDIFHAWQMGAGILPEARDSLSKAAEFIRRYISIAKVL